MNKYGKAILKSFHLNWKSALIVAIVNIPLSISLAIASGATPIQGLLTAIWAGIIASIFASSRFNIFGPAGALSGILLSAALSFGPAYLPLIAVVSGIFMLLVYLLNITRYITLIPAAGLQGFLFSVGIIILVGQLGGGLGITIPASDKVYMTVWSLIQNIQSINWISFAVFAFGLFFLFFCKKKFPKIPGAIFLSLIGIGIGYMGYLGWLPKITMLSDKYPEIAFSFFYKTYSIDMYRAVVNDFGLILNIIKIALVITIVTILETIVSGKIAEKRTKQKFNKNKEVLGNALANIGSGLVGGLPATAVLVRTSLNVENGAKNKSSAFMAAIITLLISLLLFSRVFVFLPIPIISAILVYISIGIMDFKVLKKFYFLKKTSFYNIMVTIIISIVEDTVIGLVFGTLITLLIFLKRVTNAELYVTVFRNKKFWKKEGISEYIEQQHVDDIVVVKLLGELNYLNIDAYLKQIQQLTTCKTIIFSFAQLSDIDIDGIEVLDEVFTQFVNQGKEIYITGLHNNKGIRKICMRIPAIKKFEANNKIHESTSSLLDTLFI